MIRSAALMSIVILLSAIVGAGPSFAQQFSPQKVRRNVEIEFETIEGASKYEIEVVQKDGKKKPMRFQTKTPSWSASIKPGLYVMTIRAFDDRGVPGSWSPPTDLKVKLPAIIPIAPEPEQSIKATEPKWQDTKFRWEAVPDAESYLITVQSGTTDFKKEKTVSAPEWAEQLPTGNSFQWNVVAIDKKGEQGEISEQPYLFEVKGPPLDRPRIEKPRLKYIREMKWSAPSFATSYSYELKYYNPESKAWEPVVNKPDFTETTLAMDYTRPSGRYRLSVQAHGLRRDSSPVSSLDFNMRGGFKTAQDFENAISRESITRPSNYYGIASYLITQIQYKGTSYDENATANFPALGGTGRLGAGYTDMNSDWGGFGIIDLSGFIIEGQNFKFASAEGHITRRLEFGQGGLLLFGTGLFFKELPIVLGSEALGFTGVGKVSNIGPHAGFTYWLPLSDRLGLQLNARTYYTLLGSATTGQKALSSMSFQLGALGSYRLKGSWMGYAGYAYRADEANYETKSDSSSYATGGQTNNISISGHYLNLILEFSF